MSTKPRTPEYFPRMKDRAAGRRMRRWRGVAKAEIDAAAGRVLVADLRAFSEACSVASQGMKRLEMELRFLAVEMQFRV